MWASSVAAAPGRSPSVLVAVAGGGLTRTDLLALTGFPPDELDALLAAASSTGPGRTASRWTGETVHVIAGAEQRRRVTEAAGERAAADCVAALHAWAESYRAGGWPDDTPEYLLDGYFRLLESTGDVPRMTACGTDRARHARLRALTGGDVVAVHEVAACQAALAEQDAPDLAAAAVLAVLSEELGSRNDGLPTSLPATLAAAGDPLRADQLARSFEAPARRTAVLTELALALLDGDHHTQARRTIAELTAAVGTLDSFTEAGAKDAVVRLAAAGQWTSAERIARAAPSRAARLASLRALVDTQIAAGHLDRAEHIALNLTSDDSATDGYRGDDTGGADRQALIPVIAALAADGQGARAESLARAFPTPDAVREFGGVFALPHLTTALAVTGQDEQFHRLVRAVPHEQTRTQLLTAAVFAIGDAERAEELARSIADDRGRADTLREAAVRHLVAGDAERALSLLREIDADIPTGPLLRALRKKIDRSDTQLLLEALDHRVRPGVVRALVEQGRTDLAESFVSHIRDDRERASASRELAGATAESDHLHAEEHNSLGLDDSAGLREVTHTHLAAGDPDQAVRTAHRAGTPHLTGQLLCDIAVWLVENGMTGDAERLSVGPEGAAEGGPGGPLDSGGGAFPHRAKILAAVAAAAAAEGDTATARRLAGLVADLPQATPRFTPLRLLLFADALVEAEEYAFARHLAERAVTLVGTSNDVLLSRAAVALARSGAVVRAEELGRGFSFWSHREPALEAVVLAYVEAGDLTRALSVAHDMEPGRSLRIRALAAVSAAMARSGDHDRAREVVAPAAETARELMYGQEQALHAVARAWLALGDVAEAERAVRAIREYGERQAAQRTLDAARTRPEAGDAPLRAWRPARPGEAPAVIAEAAKWLKEAGDEGGAAQLLADAAEYARATGNPGDGRAADSLRNATAAEDEPPAWIRQLLARALCGIGRYWDFVLPGLAAVDRRALLAVAEALGLGRPGEPGAEADDVAGGPYSPSRQARNRAASGTSKVAGRIAAAVGATGWAQPAAGSGPYPVDRQHGRSYAGLTADQLIDRVVLCRRAGRTEDPGLRVVLDGLRRDYGHEACPFAASLERLAHGTHGPALFQEGMQPDEVEIVSRILERLMGGPGAP
ncbi:hypothetical protein ACFVH0_26540 [Streptomyces sp. NPDC127117]|uniref:hypothetical protein n=1 Tax=Streptomyces sp. NPDC127117 TaxID=3345368 RepID=UPI003631B4CC